MIYEGEDCTGNVVWRTGINSTVHVCYKNLGTMGGRSVQVEPLWAPY